MIIVKSGCTVIFLHKCMNILCPNYKTVYRTRNGGYCFHGHKIIASLS